MRGEFVQVVVFIEGVDFSEVDKFLQRFIYEYEADEWGKRFLCETCDVTNKRTGICSHQHNTEESRPQADAGPQRQIRQAVLPARRLTENKCDYLLFELWQTGESLHHKWTSDAQRMHYKELIHQQRV